MQFYIFVTKVLSSVINQGVPGAGSRGGTGSPHGSELSGYLPIIIIINFHFITLTYNAETWDDVIELSSQTFSCHGRVALSASPLLTQPGL